jgi:predicted amidophosphoribosyltransferase
VLGLHTAPDGSGYRTDLGDAVNNYKYNNDICNSEKVKVYGDSLAHAVEKFVRRAMFEFDIISFVPPSIQRSFQPVPIFARLLGKRLGIPVVNNLVRTRETESVKTVAPEDRDEYLRGVYDVSDDRLRGKRVLLLDDIIDTGATADAVTVALKNRGKARSVCFIALTATMDGYEEAGYADGDSDEDEDEDEDEDDFLNELFDNDEFADFVSELFDDEDFSDYGSGGSCDDDDFSDSDDDGYRRRGYGYSNGGGRRSGSRYQYSNRGKSQYQYMYR